MRRAVSIIGGYVLVLLSAFLPAQQTAAPSPTLPPPLVTQPQTPAPTPAPRPEVRALWVVRHTMTSPDAVRDMVRRAKENGFTDLIVQVRGRGDAYYDSQLEPRAEDLVGQPPGFDPLALTLDEAHRVGIKVHAWINIYLVASFESLPRNRSHLLYQHPEWLMVPRGLASELYGIEPRSQVYLNRLVEYTRENQADVEGLFISPAHPAVKDNLYNLWLEVAQKYEVDGLHFDYVRYPNTNYDFSRTSLERFRQELEKNLEGENREFLSSAADSDPLLFATTFPDRYAQFQRQQVSELVERIYKGVKKVKPHAVISAAVFANDDDALRTRFQDWKHWLRAGWLDAVCPMAYTPETESFRRLIANAKTYAAGKQVWAGIGAFKQPAESALEKVRVTREVGAQGFILFSYDSSVKASDLNPQGDYLEKLHAGLRDSAGVTIVAPSR